jgi:hypothetical protein
MLAPAMAALAQAVAETRGGRRRLRRGGRNGWPAPARIVLRIPSFAGAAGVRGPSGLPSLGVSSPDSRPRLHSWGLFSGHNVYYRVLAYFAELPGKFRRPLLPETLDKFSRGV